MAGASVLLLGSNCIAAAAAGRRTKISDAEVFENSYKSLTSLQKRHTCRILYTCEGFLSRVHSAPRRNEIRQRLSSAATALPIASGSFASGHRDRAAGFLGEPVDLKRKNPVFAKDSGECRCCLFEEGEDFARVEKDEDGESEVVSAGSPAGVGRRQLMASAILLAASTALMAKLESATAAVADGERADLTKDFALELYRDSKNGFTLLRPTSWNKVDKPGAVIFFEDPKSRGSNIGVTVAPVKIASLDSFGTVDDVARRVVKAERDKGSTKDVQVISQFETKLKNDVRLYSLEYLLDTTRGGKHVLTSVTVTGYKLYVLSIVFPEDGAKSGPSVLNDALHQVLGSFDLLV